MEYPHNQHPGPVHAGNLDASINSLEKDPEIYYSWMIWTLETGFADQDAEQMADILGKFNDIISGHDGLSLEAWPDGAMQDVQAAARKMHAEVESRTKGTVAELNLAREVYKDQLPDIFIKITDSEEWHLVEGFAADGYSKVHPIIHGKTYEGFVVQVQHAANEDDVDYP